MEPALETSRVDQGDIAADGFEGNVKAGKWRRSRFRARTRLRIWVWRLLSP
jgi:hypothetical protein